MANLGTLTLDLIAKIGGFTGPMEKAERQSNKTAKQITRDQARAREEMKHTLSTAAKWGVGIAAGAATAAVAFTKMSLQAADTIGKVAATAGVTTDTLQEMRHAASLSGISFDDLDKGMQSFNKRLGELKAGTGSLYTFLNKTDKALIDQLKTTRSTDDALDLMFKSMEKVTDESQRAALAASAFGRSGQRITIMTESYEKLRKEARDLGLVIDADLIKNAEAANDKLDTLSRVISTQLTSAVLELAPAIQTIAQAMIDITPGLNWILGGSSRFDKKIQELNAISKEYQDLIALQKEWKDIEQTQLSLKAQKGSLFSPETLDDARSNLEAISEAIKDLNQQRVPKQAPITSTDRSGGTNSETESDSWEQFGKVLKRTTEFNKQKLEIINKSNAAIRAANEKMLQEDIARDNELRQLTERADIAQLNNISDAHQREIALHEYKFERLKELYEVGSEELLQIERLQAAERMHIVQESNDSYWKSYLESMENNMSNMDEIVGDSISNMSAKFGDLFATAIFESKNLGEAFKNMALGMAKSMVSAVGQMIAQWIIYKAAKAAIDKSAQAASVTALVANAQASSIQAGINAFSSTAAIPIVGPTLAPAAMGAALAVTKPMADAVSALALAGMAHDGIDSIPETGTWLLQKGERVLTSGTSERLDNTLKRIEYVNMDGGSSTSNNSMNRGMGETTLNMNFKGPTFLNRAQMRDAGRMLIDVIEQEKTRRGVA